MFNLYLISQIKSRNDKKKKKKGKYHTKKYNDAIEICKEKMCQI